MRSFMFYVVQVGIVLAGVDSEPKEINADNQNQINRRSLTVMKRIVRGWEPSSPGMLKRYDTSDVEVRNLSPVNGLEPRSASPDSTLGSSWKPDQGVSKRRHSIQVKTKITKTNGQVKTVKKTKIYTKGSSHSKGLTYKKKVVVKTEPNKNGHNSYLKVKVKQVTQTKNHKNKHSFGTSKVRKIVRKLLKKKRVEQKKSSYTSVKITKKY